MEEELVDSKLDARVVKKLRKILDERNIKQSTLAKALNYEPSWGSHLMTGKRGLTVNQLIKIAEFLDIHPCELLPDIGKKPDINLDEYISFVVKRELEECKKK